MFALLARALTGQHLRVRSTREWEEEARGLEAEFEELAGHRGEKARGVPVSWMSTYEKVVEIASWNARGTQKKGPDDSASGPRVSNRLLAAYQVPVLNWSSSVEPDMADSEEAPWVMTCVTASK